MLDNAHFFEAADGFGDCNTVNTHQARHVVLGKIGLESDLFLPYTNLNLFEVDQVNQHFTNPHKVVTIQAVLQQDAIHADLVGGRPDQFDQKVWVFL